MTINRYQRTNQPIPITESAKNGRYWLSVHLYFKQQKWLSRSMAMVKFD